MKIFLNCAVMSIAIVLAIACGKSNNSTPTQPGGGGTSPPESQPAAISKVEQISSAPDKRALVDRKVEIADAVVQNVVGTYTFWVGDPHSGVVVFRQDRLSGPVSEHVKKGDHVRISGTVRLLETLSSTDPLWEHINENERRDIMNAGVYVSAKKVQVVHR